MFTIHVGNWMVRIEHWELSIENRMLRIAFRVRVFLWELNFCSTLIVGIHRNDAVVTGAWRHAAAPHPNPATTHTDVLIPLLSDFSTFFFWVGRSGGKVTTSPRRGDVLSLPERSWAQVFQWRTTYLVSFFEGHGTIFIQHWAWEWVSKGLMRWLPWRARGGTPPRANRIQPQPIRTFSSSFLLFFPPVFFAGGWSGERVCTSPRPPIFRG